MKKNLLKNLILGAVCASTSYAMAGGTLERFAERTAWGSFKLVDYQWGRSQLSDFRPQVRLDTCLQPHRRESSFGMSIEAAVRASLDARIIKTNSAIQRGYGLPDESRSEYVGLLSHPLCEQDRQQVSHMLGDEYVPDQETLNYLSEFISASNRDRREALQGRSDSMGRFLKRWTVFMGCLAYAESLDIINPEVEFDADANFQEALARQPKVERFFADPITGQTQRPSGVWFGADRDGDYYIQIRAHAAAGTLTEEIRAGLSKKYSTWPVVGLFQFKASAGGNTAPCVRQWNEYFRGKKVCQLNEGSSDQLLMGFGSHGQSMNAFCGVQKIVQSFNSQIHTIHSTGTDLANILPGQRLKKPRDRCVSLVSRAGRNRVYSHFGPLRNSVKDNLKKVMKCTQEALR